jgi:hypothetical protein
MEDRVGDGDDGRERPRRLRTSPYSARIAAVMTRKIAAECR